jgi:hypothetical protein
MVDPRSATWFLRNSATPGIPDFTPLAFGLPAWQPLAGNWTARPGAPPAGGARSVAAVAPLGAEELGPAVAAALGRLRAAGVDPQTGRANVGSAGDGNERMADTLTTGVRRADALDQVFATLL